MKFIGVAIVCLFEGTGEGLVAGFEGSGVGLGLGLGHLHFGTGR